MKGKLIVLEGTDASGKSTQLALLAKNLDRLGIDFRRLAFPQYDEPSSSLIRMYLNGEFGKKPEDVNPYAASAFFAVDRYASYKKVWQQEYEAGKTILCDRYVTSNAIYQAAKLNPKEREAYLDWLYEFEYKLLGLPAPDAVLFLDMPPKEERELLKNRIGKTKDIHEADESYLQKCYETALAVSEKWNFLRISCIKNGTIRTIEEIEREISNLTIHLLGGNLPDASI